MEDSKYIKNRKDTFENEEDFFIALNDLISELKESPELNKFQIQFYEQIRLEKLC